MQSGFPDAAAPGAPAAVGSSVDESLSQVAAALAASGATAAAPFAMAGQGNFSVEQLRAYLPPVRPGGTGAYR